MIKTTHNLLEELSLVISQLSDEQYSSPCLELEGETIGRHVRHITDLFDCLIEQYESGCINYELRKRNTIAESSVTAARNSITNILQSIQKSEKPLRIDAGELSESQLQIDSSYQRELMYNIEHCIHHQALIKIGLRQFTHIQIPQNFGIAPSTVKFRLTQASSSS